MKINGPPNILQPLIEESGMFDDYVSEFGLVSMYVVQTKSDTYEDQFPRQMTTEQEHYLLRNGILISV